MQFKKANNQTIKDLKQQQKLIHNKIEKPTTKKHGLQIKLGQDEKRAYLEMNLDNKDNNKRNTLPLTQNQKYPKLNKPFEPNIQKTTNNKLENSELKKRIKTEKQKKKQERLEKFKKNGNVKKTTNQKRPLEPKFSPLYPQTKNARTTPFEAEWKNVHFNNGSIIVHHEGNSYKKDTPQSKKHLNEIKHYYNFHNIPKLKIIPNGSTIKRIENEEVLFYHIDFLTIAASNFGLILLNDFQISKWRKYTKQYYKTKLPFLFHTHTLKTLCEYCDSELPIIPVGETVINRNGSKTIHNSFLFPIKGKFGYSIVWESIEESKASYIFTIKSFSDTDVQNLFDYIAGDTPNKRQTLIQTKSLQLQLRMKGRLLHKDLTTWNNEIRMLLR